MTTNLILKPNFASNKSDENADVNSSEIQQQIENFNIGKFYELTVNEEQTRHLTRPDQVIVYHIQVYEEKNLKKELKALAKLQDTDEKLAVIKKRVTKYQYTDQTQFVLQDNVLYCRGEKTGQRYKLHGAENI